MRAVQFGRYGDPKDVLFLANLPQPEPGPHQVRVRITHRAVNPSDIRTITGDYGTLPAALPATVGFEGMGIIDAAGAKVSGWTVGQRVVPLGVRGTWCEYVLVSPNQLIPVHDHVNDQTAAQFIVNPVTAWVMLTSELNLQPGDWLLQTAAGSTLGQLIIQLGQMKGFKTINLVRRRKQVDELLALGADAVVCTEDTDVVKRIKELTDGKGVGGAIDAVGGKTGGLAVSCLAPGKTLLVYGLLSMQLTPINTGEMIFRGTTVRGFWLTHWFRTTPQHKVAATLMELMQLIAQGKLMPPVEAEYDLADFRAAIAHAERPGRSGKVLLVG
ncbi:MAG: zinc-dependent alcohol dehydrogenase family protein [Anaerolineae bacterium]|nr:zinc-dependent alcohol dehydrogenase family protein [Anaerolineae bacterium]